VCFLQAMAGMLMVGVDSTHARWLTKNSAPMNESEAKVQFGGECILSSPLILSFDPTNATGKKEKRLLFVSHLYIKCIILPRQARDKHRESTQKRTTCTVFLIAIDSVWPIITNTEV